jgi:hypothetical protein
MQAEAIDHLRLGVLGFLARERCEVQHGSGEAIERLLERIYATPKSVIERVKAITE